MSKEIATTNMTKYQEHRDYPVMVIEQMPVRILKNIEYKKNVWGDLVLQSETNSLQYLQNGTWTNVPVELQTNIGGAGEVDAKDITV